MKEYRCYFLNRRGGIGDVIAFTSADDGAALNQAQTLFGRQSDFPSYEMWERTRLVFRDPTERHALQG